MVSHSIWKKKWALHGIYAPEFNSSVYLFFLSWLFKVHYFLILILFVPRKNKPFYQIELFSHGHRGCNLTTFQKWAICICLLFITLERHLTWQRLIYILEPVIIGPNLSREELMAGFSCRLFPESLAFLRPDVTFVHREMESLPLP